MKKKPYTLNTPYVNFALNLTLLFIGLRLYGAIAWAWWWVLAPLWVPCVLIAGVNYIAEKLGKITQS